MHAIKLSLLFPPLLSLSTYSKNKTKTNLSNPSSFLLPHALHTIPLHTIPLHTMHVRSVTLRYVTCLPLFTLTYSQHRKRILIL
ncbi:hypothetical protein DM02DRAFT_608001 [Periconia macrospinosa]|uniref:REJ domain-containing protein n=1 Tax=Periconia macrospinosa TaxID=97972 RepID=A0A2V1EGG5_9PLEO|nr:hypothetical protein DM02DRAFT_608001 [Periconia macrospinosa]